MAKFGEFAGPHFLLRYWMFREADSTPADAHPISPANITQDQFEHLVVSVLG